MSRPYRVGAIYRKELLSILRDRRTMIAMVVIPVVLYPVLMLGFVRAVESEHLWLQGQRFTVEVSDKATAESLGYIIQVARALHASTQTDASSIPDFDIRIGQTPPAQLGGEVQLHVSLTFNTRPKPFPDQIRAEIVYNEIDVRSNTALEALSKLVRDYGEGMTRQALGDLLKDHPRVHGPHTGDVELVLKPVDLRTLSAATDRQRGGWALGRIVPVILVLMTITGAIYPAIDLTAGERERGTLEALLATPVPILDLTVAKFLVVATIGLLAAVINVSSVGATMHFGGLTRSIAEEMPVEFPASALPIIMLCMVPFAMLSAAVLLAACSFARSFKEAQNYAMPVIVLAMIPAMAATLPTIQLRGPMLVLPVGNMVLLTRELFQQTYTWTQVLVVLLSTSLYAAAAVAVAARLFGQEAVLFADAASYKTLLQRRLLRPRVTPSASQALLLAALLFPATFYANSVLVDTLEEGFIRTMGWLAVVQFLGLFVLLPLAVAVYFKIDVVQTFRLRPPPARAWLAAALLGLSSWAVAQEFFTIQARYLIQPSQALRTLEEQLAPQLAAAPLWVVVLLLAVVPAVCEEALFRGFLQSGLGSALRKWGAIIAVAAVFGVFHFLIDRMPVTALLGVLLGYLCWQCRSIWPGIIAHAMHNTVATVLVRFPDVVSWLGIDGQDAGPASHLPPRVLVPAAVLFVSGIILLASLGNVGAARATSRGSAPGGCANPPCR